MKDIPIIFSAQGGSMIYLYSLLYRIRRRAKAHTFSSLYGVRL